jgi:hypothetical protein
MRQCASLTWMELPIIITRCIHALFSRALLKGNISVEWQVRKRRDRSVRDHQEFSVCTRNTTAKT